MKHIEYNRLATSGENAFAFWKREHHRALIIQRKRLPADTPKEVRVLRDLWVKGGRASMVRYIRETCPEISYLRDAIDVCNELLEGNWRRFGG